MTSVLNFNSSSSTSIPPLASNSFFSNSKLPTTFIIQPPSTQITSNTLLAKRCKPAELGDLLMKKIKTQTLSSGSQSPMIKDNSEESDSNCLESTSMLEEINSPSTKSFCEDIEAHHTHNMLEGILIPQRSISTPLVVNTFNLRHAKADSADSHSRIQHALVVLQKKMLMDQQANLLREILFKAHSSGEQIVIPPLLSASESPSSPVDTHGKVKKLAGFDHEDIIFGPVEYPLLAMAPPIFGGDFLQKDALNCLSNPSVKFGESLKKKNGLFGSLAATRAETQRSDTDDVSSCTSEESIEELEIRKRKSKKTTSSKKSESNGKGKKGEKKEKGQGKEKTKNSKKQK